MKTLMKKLFKTQPGRFIAGLTALLLTIAVVVGAGKLNFLKADTTAQRVMTIDSAAKEIVRAIDEETAILYLTGAGNKDMWLDELLRKYEVLNAKISYEAIEASSAFGENMIVISSRNRTVSISEADMYKITYDPIEYYISGALIESSRVFSADEEIANALLYVTREDMPTIYMLSGHGETTFTDTVFEELWRNNIGVETLVLADEVPEDAALVVICAPAVDITPAEADALLKYMKSGGRLILMTNYLLFDAPNLNSIMAYYGMQSKYGVVVDMADGYCYDEQVPYYLTPAVSAHGITQPLLDVNTTMLMPMSGALERNEIVRDMLTVTELLTTSEESYLKNPHAMTVLEKEDGDADGPFVLAMAAEEGESRAVWFAGSEFINDENMQYSNELNLYLIDGIREWMLPQTPERISIEDENLIFEAISVPENQKVLVYIALFVPALAVLLAGAMLIPKKSYKQERE